MRGLMKKIALLAVMVALVDGSWQCLNCKLQDTNAGFLYSYSYCNDKIIDEEICQPDLWNVISPKAKCAQVENFKPGWQLDIFDDCEVEENIGRCQNFDSNPEFEGVYINVTRTLGDNEMCTIRVNATAFTARVVFDDSDKLGVLYPGYKMGQPITVEKGKIKYLQIYNGNDAGPTQFKISFSSAQKLLVQSLALLLTVVSFY